MIRVNLLRSTGLASAAPAGTMVGASASVDFSDNSAVNKLAAGKIAVMAVFPLLLYAYEYSNVSSLQDQFKAVDSEATKTEEKKKAFGDVAPKVEKFSKQKKKIDRQMTVIRDLAKNRLREVKALDQIQKITPPSVWFTELTMAEGVVSAKGFSSSTDGVDQLFTALSNSPIFSDIRPGKTGGTVDAQGNPSSSFEVTFRIGKAEGPT